MSWRRSGAAAILSLAALTGACGYQPIYGTAPGIAGETVAAELAQIRIAVIPNRTGQILRNYLIRSLNPDGRPDRPLYTLNVRVSEVEEDLGIRKDDTATRANLVVSANFRLVDRDGQPVTSGTVQTITSYNLLLDQFATLSAERDARDRALRQISEDIRTRLALHFNREA